MNKNQAFSKIRVGVAALVVAFVATLASCGSGDEAVPPPTTEEFDNQEYLKDKIINTLTDGTVTRATLDEWCRKIEALPNPYPPYREGMSEEAEMALMFAYTDAYDARLHQLMDPTYLDWGVNSAVTDQNNYVSIEDWAWLVSAACFDPWSPAP